MVHRPGRLLTPWHCRWSSRRSVVRWPCCSRELPLHAAFIGDEEAFPAFRGEVNAPVHRLEMRSGLKRAVGEEIESHGIGERGAEGLDEIESEGGAAVGGFMVKSDGGVEADGVEPGFGLGPRGGCRRRRARRLARYAAGAERRSKGACSGKNPP